MKSALLKKAQALPEKPGCYLFTGSNRQILYVGKSINIQKRVLSYFSDTSLKSDKIISQSEDIQTFVTPTEVEALILENNLIKRHRPRYNVLLKDDKSYPYIELAMGEEYPALYFSRNTHKEKSRYFGPYPSAGAVKRIIAVMEKFFQLRTCRADFYRRKRPCMKYQVKRCSAPCVGKISHKEYMASIEKACLFLEGKAGSLEKALRHEMDMLSGNMEYEKAAEIRDLINDIKGFNAGQFADLNLEESLDAFGMIEENGLFVMCVFHFRAGRLVDKSEYIVRDEENIFQTVIEQIAVNMKYPVQRMIFNRLPSNSDLIADYLTKKFGKKVAITEPVRGKYRKIILRCEENAHVILKKEYDSTLWLNDMQQALKLKRFPERIECIDISHTSGDFTVGSLVVFKNGKPDKSSYRRYKIKSVEGIDDFSSVSEVVDRRCSRIISGEMPPPDLMIIDGGKGQLRAAREVLRKYDMEGLFDLGALAKKEEQFFSDVLEDGHALNLKKNYARIIIQLRDEAHRFAVSYNRLLRNKSFLESELLKIKGIGKVKCAALLNTFGSIDDVLSASDNALSEVLTQNDITNLRSYFAMS